jgi:hypothetical protein
MQAFPCHSGVYRNAVTRRNAKSWVVGWDRSFLRGATLAGAGQATSSRCRAQQRIGHTTGLFVLVVSQPNAGQAQPDCRNAYHSIVGWLGGYRITARLPMPSRINAGLASASQRRATLGRARPSVPRAAQAGACHGSAYRAEALRSYAKRGSPTQCTVAHGCSGHITPRQRTPCQLVSRPAFAGRTRASRTKAQMGGWVGSPRVVAMRSVPVPSRTQHSQPELRRP